MVENNDINHYELPFKLKLARIDAYGEQDEVKPISSTFIEFKTVRSFSEKEGVLVWNLPLVALQPKIGEDGRFVLPKLGVIDDVFSSTLADYRVAVNAPFSSMLTLYWIKQGAFSKGKVEETDGSGSSENDKKTLKEKDWDYVFQANKILHCSLVNPSTSRMERALHAAFRLKTSNEDDAEPDLPQDDERAKIPVWTLTSEPSRAYVRETNNELETSAMISGHSKKSFEIGAGLSYKKFSAEGKYERTTESSFKDESTYGQKQSTMLTFYEIPIVELSLHKSNCRVSDPCRQHLVKLRNGRSFDSLMDFFDKYGTVYANNVVLGGRLVTTKRFQESTQEKAKERQKNVKNAASGSIGIDPISIKGGYSDEQGEEEKNTKKEKTDQTQIDWMGYGDNAALVSDPAKWLPTVAEYRNWKIVENAEVESIQDFIGSLPGNEDIPSLFQDILASGLYSPEIVHLGPRPQLLRSGGLESLDTAKVGTAVNTLAIPTEKPMEYPFAKELPENKVKILAKGGVSWRVLDSNEAVRLEIASTMQVVMNIGANRSVIPTHLYHLSMEPRTISIVLQWSSDLIEKGFSLASPDAVPVVISDGNKALLEKKEKETDVAEYIKAMGHGFIESYTEKNSMTAIWNLSLTGTSDKTFYVCRMMIQKYFFQPRGISEVCDFFSSETRFSKYNSAPRVRVSIFGYRDCSSKLPEDILDKPSSHAKQYLTPQVLSRNKERQAIRLRPWNYLNSWLKDKLAALEPITFVAPQEFFVLNVQRAQRLLLLLDLYSKNIQHDIRKGDLERCRGTLDRMLGPGVLDSKGVMTKESRDLLVLTIQTLEKLLPEEDPEKNLK